MISALTVAACEVGRVGLYRLTDVGSKLFAGDLAPANARRWRLMAWLSPALPLVALVVPRSAVIATALAAVSLLALLLHSAALRTQVWVAAYQPDLIPTSCRPLGARPKRDADRRLHLLLRTHVLHAIPLIAVLALVAFDGHPLQVAVALLFFLRYVGHAATDLEACTHWHMHCEVFAVQGRGRWLERVWVAAMDWIVGPLNGYVPYVYPANHLLLHHVFNSGERDPHSTSSYRRTSFVDFSHFAFRMARFTMFATDIVQSDRCKGGPRRRALLGVAMYWFVTILALSEGRLLGVALLLVAVHHSLAMSRDAWTWHGLLRPARSATPMATTTLWVSPATTTLLDLPLETWASAAPDPEVAWAFYDNLHLVHHLHPSAHFTEYLDLFSRELTRIQDRHAAVLSWEMFETFPELCWTNDLATVSEYMLGDEEGRSVTTIAELLEPFGSADGRSLHDAYKGPTLKALDRRLPVALRRLAEPIGTPSN